MNITNLDKQIEESTKHLDDKNKVLGKTLMQPMKPANSGARALMSAVHVEHLMIPTHAEVPIVQTGYETEFGVHSSSYVTAKANYEVIAKIFKFENKIDNYYMIVRDIDTGVYDVIQRTPYNHNTESYGFLWDNHRIDALNVGDKIPKGSIINTSTGFDEYGSKKNGVNLVTLYLSCAQNMEDSIIISESAAKKLETSLIKTTSITINDNDVLLNMYGDENIYKTFPDVGEHTNNGVFCSIRRLENDNVLYSLSQSRLREPMISDRNILIDGIVVDINVYCNNPSALGDSHYNKQLFYYYNQRNIFCQNVVNIVGPIAMNGAMSYDLQKLYANCRDAIGGKQYFKDKQFSNVIMEVAVIQQLPMSPGDKMCDRYGGKGVVSKVRPDALMPKLDNGVIVEVIKNQSTCINRENAGQLHEQSLTFIGMRLLDYFREGVFTTSQMCEILYKFISMIDKNQANMLMGSIDFYDEHEANYFMDSVFDDDAIIISSPPMTTPINIDTINAIYKEFSWIKPYTVMMPMEDSNGSIRYIPARRNLVAGKIYNYRLKQYAEEKFSVTSLSATNLKGLNTRSKANKIYETKFTRTPIMFGPMESVDLGHIGMQNVVMNLMLYSASPQARRLFEQLLIGDPYNVNIKLDANSKNRNAEIINALLQTCGIELEFIKEPKELKHMVLKEMFKDVPNKDYKYKTNIRDYIGHDGELQLHYDIALRDKSGKQMVGKIMCNIIDKDDKNVDGVKTDSKSTRKRRRKYSD